METQIDPIFDQDSRNELRENMDQQQYHPKQSFFKKKLTIGILLFALVAVAVGSVFLFRIVRDNAPKSEKVSVAVKGPKELASGNEAEYVIIYQNAENADLIEVSLEIFYPSNFKFNSSQPEAKTSNGTTFELPVLKQGQQAEVKIRGKLTGKVGEVKEVKARLHYKLSNFNSIFTKEEMTTTTILSPNLVLEITGPIDVTNGQESNFAVNYENVSQQEYESVVLKMHYPPGFKFAAANPPPSRSDNIWNLGKLPVGWKGKIDINGSFTGDPNQEKLVVGELGFDLNNNFAPQVTASVAFKVVPSTLNLVQSSNPNTYATLGGNIQYVLDYGNFGTLPMTNVVVSITVESAAAEFSQIQSNDAIIAGNNLTWKSATLKELALVRPNQQGRITFNLPLKKSLSTNLKNQVIKTSAQIFSDQIKTPIRTADMEIKLISNLGLLISGKYASGANPPQAGQTTTYAITMILTNGSNDLEDTELIASVPLPDSAWKSVIFPESESQYLTFDSNSNKIRWKVGKLPAFSGKFSTARTVTFQLEVTPNSNESGNQTLLKDIQAIGTDTFVNTQVESTKVENFSSFDLD